MFPLSAIFRPTIDALLSPNLSFSNRWRLLAFQPISLLIVLLNGIPCFFSRRATTFYIPTRSGPKRVLVWRPKPISSPSTTCQSTRLLPLHLMIHGGGFIGGDPSSDYRFCSTLADRCGCVVVGASYRFAPRHPFPAAIDDIDDIVSWLKANAESKLSADPQLFTIGGSSAGGNLALAAAQAKGCHGQSATAFKASVTFYAPVDLSIPPWEKPAEQGVPKKDPMRFLMPLYDSYAAPGRPGTLGDPRCSPTLADATKLPEMMLFVIPAIDIIVKEQLMMIERLSAEIQKLGEAGKTREVKSKIMAGCFHGWLELPDVVLNKRPEWARGRKEVFDECVDFIKSVHQRYGYQFYQN